MKRQDSRKGLSASLAQAGAKNAKDRESGRYRKPVSFLASCLEKKKSKGLKMELGTKYAVINYQVCEPNKCDPHQGICKAAQVCPHDLLIQEEPGDPPMLYSTRMYVGCGDYVRECPLNAINIQYE